MRLQLFREAFPGNQGSNEHELLGKKRAKRECAGQINWGRVNVGVEAWSPKAP